MKKILIVSYYLGTNKGVGGKRWLNYANHLCTLGYEITILTTSLRSEIEQLNPKINIVNFTSNYPEILTKNRLNFFQKFHYKLEVLHRKLHYKGSIYDKGKGLENLLIIKINEIIDNRQIDNIIVTGAPFSFQYFVTKHFHQKLNIISDFRDPWTWGIGYGMSLLSSKRMQYEKSCELQVLKKSHFILCASTDLANVLIPKLELIKKKPVVILNALERINIEISDKNLKTIEDKILISHIGTIALETEKYWKTFLKFIYSSKHNITVNIYGNSNIKFESFVKNSSLSKINFVERLGLEDLGTKIKESDFVVLFKMDSFPNTFPTKFFDYISYKKPIIAFTKKGKVSDEIEINKIGVVLNEKSSLNEFDNFLDNYSDTFYDNFDYSKFLISTEIKKLIKLIN